MWKSIPRLKKESGFLFLFFLKISFSKFPCQGQTYSLWPMYCEALRANVLRSLGGVLNFMRSVANSISTAHNRLAAAVSCQDGVIVLQQAITDRQGH